ncbi:sodium:proton antiporter [Bradyrhizobium sp. sBnM-33]|uniref:sodium:proton antiporter n=1 Tax=Bradyrhizobium sp. sBnM-33 TaxID=2831780 RepID=UPI001BCAE36E|nr:sodium:proton antiporter [Bradyrhizobium sp. sBnM-33]WOH47640.1 sodium:proton antiporter [Bradyrhizobium sp. sBnM-33]
MLRAAAIGVTLTMAFPTIASASEGAHLVGSQLSLLWGLPFVGILTSIALFPLIAPKFWEHHFGKIAAFWAAMLLVPCAISLGPLVTATELHHTAVLEYFPFIILLFSLFVVAGGIQLVGNLIGNPATNTAMLAIGTMAASLVGTTGASMLLIRPLIRANQDRHRNRHVFIFFIFLVANIGGSLTPLGDPPLFLGFLKGVDFLWTMTAMFPPMLVASAVLLVLFYFIDRHHWRKEGADWPISHLPRQLRIEGLHNIVYLAGIIAAVLLSGVWKPDVDIPLGLGVALPLEGLVRDIILLALGYLSWRTTPRSIRVENAFAWTPIQEVAFLFAGIFVTIIPVLAILRAGRDGALAPLLTLVTTPDGRPIEAAYFWLTGALSSFLDNAPTYLVFFNLAGGDAQLLMGPLFNTLLAISAGAVFMGANTYIGNAPNFMVKAICEERGIRMPSFFGYMLWSGGILLPLFAVLTLIFFR